MSAQEREPRNMRKVVATDLTKLLGHGPGSFEIVPLPQDASMRRYYRVSGAAFSDSVKGDSIILMALADPNPRAKSEEIVASNDKEAAGNGYEETDLDFVAVLRHFEKIGIPVPSLYLYNMDKGFLYIEDLGDTLLENHLAENPADMRGLYEKAIDIMFILHRRGMTVSDENFVGFKRGFDEKLLFYEFMHYVEYGIEGRKKVKVDPEDLEVIRERMRLISAELAAEPKVLSHRDFQSRNLMLQGEDLRLIDFQDALMAPRQYDLVCLLRDSYVVIGDDMVDGLIEYYVKRLESETGDKADRARFRRVFDLLTLQRKIKDAGRFDYIDIVKHNPKFLQYIPDTLAYVREAFDRLPEHEPLRRKLAKYEPRFKSGP